MGLLILRDFQQSELRDERAQMIREEFEQLFARTREMSRSGVDGIAIHTRPSNLHALLRIPVQQPDFNAGSFQSFLKYSEIGATIVIGDD
jgi:hypothetical protein